MSIAVSTDARVKDVKVTDELITFYLGNCLPHCQPRKS